MCFLRHLSLAFICEAILYHYLNFSSLQGHEKWMFGTARQFLEKKKKLLEKFAHCPKTLFFKDAPLRITFLSHCSLKGFSVKGCCTFDDLGGEFFSFLDSVTA